MNPNTKALPFFKPLLGRREIAAAARVLRSGWLTTGPEALAFEDEFASFLQVDDLRALCVNSATSGLHLALEAVGVGPGDLVAVPSLTFTATAEVVRYLGADPVFVDSESESGNMDPRALDSACHNAKRNGRRIKAVIPVHLAGKVCDMESINGVLAGSETAVIEDAAHAFPSRTDMGSAGTLGDIGVFSFYATKTITTGEGGMVVTRNAVYAERMRLMRLHGIDKAVWNRYSAGAARRSWEYDVIAPGFKYNMTDLAAAVGRVQLSRADHLHELRVKLAHRYIDALGGLDGLELPVGGPDHAWHLFIIRLPDKEMRNRSADMLYDKGIGSSVHFIPLHRMEYWKNRYKLNPADFPVAENLADRILSLPLWPGMKRRDQDRVIRTVRESLRG
ncbi:MAG: DegT/DnrJ/EryC1/StrS family aminotransferase [Spirochaetaceae bacterium]|nr:DegT/DnrJ/EryC1/StrS family aminotransferase [Spirochaetaceae bacterium]MDT8297137.1 DegT/DnrJ/EryC1/StrS family aminotransferase [Spirochaetaceae bacterium]